MNLPRKEVKVNEAEVKQVILFPYFSFQKIGFNICKLFPGECQAANILIHCAKCQS